MDKLISYRELIKRQLTDLATLINKQHQSNESEVDSEVVFDDERGHYLLVKIGWAGKRRVRATTLHLRMRSDKIWIEEDMTEEGIANDLMAQGVPKDDIVLAFYSPQMREHTEFAIA